MLLNTAAISHLLPACRFCRPAGYGPPWLHAHADDGPFHYHLPQGKALCLLKTQFAKKPKNPV
jgi:hypothetical protein